MEITLERIGPAKFEAKNEKGHVVIMDGPPSVGGQDEAARPMQVVLMALAGCSAIDVLHILGKGKQTVTTLRVRVDGERADAVPAVFAKIAIHFAVGGDVTEPKLERAVRLSMEKYCSVAKMLDKTAEITFSHEYLGPETSG